jgi:hypothetical protein
MYKYLKLIHNVLQCVLWSSSNWNYLKPLRNGVIANMAYLAEFWLILESVLIESAPHKMFDEMI